MTQTIMYKAKYFDTVYSKFVEDELNHRASAKTPFCHDEQIMNNRFKGLISMIKSDSSVNLYKSIAENKAHLEASDAYKVIRRMPKGIMQHIHLPAAITLDFFIELTYSDNVYYDRESGFLKVDREDGEQLNKQFIKLNQLRKLEDPKLVDAEIKNLITISLQSIDKSSTEAIFVDFEKKFSSMGNILFYEPHFLRVLEHIVLYLIKDGYQGAELRHIFGLNINKDYSKPTIDQELAFFANEKARLAKLYPNFVLTFIATPVKSGDKAHFNELTEFYTKSLSKYPELIKGFDLVQFEGLKPLYDYVEDLVALKKKHEGFNLFLHAGETYDNDNNNMIVAIMLGSKRIGHGLSSLRSLPMLELLKQNDICVEVNPYSNYLLGYVKDLRWHPAKQMINYDVPFTINPDDYTLWGAEGGSFDFFLAALYWDFDLRDLKWCILNSFKYSCLSNEDQALTRKWFDALWSAFIEEIMMINLKSSNKE